MRKGFTKIPNSVLDQPLSIEALGLFTWLSINADKEGRVTLSLNEISRRTGLNKMQVRRYLEKLRLTQLVTQLATQPATHLPNVTTICYLSSYKAEKTEVDTTSDIAADTTSDTLRAYKNDNINIMSLSKTLEDNSSLRSEYTHTTTAREKFVEWLKKECPYIASHLTIPTEQQFEKLKATYGSQAIMEECQAIENRADLRKKYKNLYMTLLNWLKRKNYATTQTYQQPRADSDHPSNEQLVRQTYDIINDLRQREAQGYNPEVLPF